MAGGVIPTIYLAHAIDQASEPDPLVTQTLEALKLLGWTVFDPAAAWSVGVYGVGSPTIHDANLAVLERCDAMVWVYDPSTPTIGSVIEATDRNRLDPGSVFVLCPLDTAKSVSARAEQWILVHTLQDLLHTLEQHLHQKGM